MRVDQHIEPSSGTITIDDRDVTSVPATELRRGIGYGILGDIVVGIVGAFLGGWLFAQLNVSLGVGGLAGQILVAFIGAVVLLLILRLLLSASRRRRRL